MKPPGSINEVKRIIELCNRSDPFNIFYVDEELENLIKKWKDFFVYTNKKYDIKHTHWICWCEWYLKKEKCKEILK